MRKNEKSGQTDYLFNRLRLLMIVTFTVIIAVTNIFAITAAGIEQNNQQQRITGTVTDGNTGDPLGGVVVQVKGTMTGEITLGDGTYSIPVTADAQTLLFTFIGYQPQEVPISGRSVIDVVMVEEVTALDEVVVIGYGTQKKSLVTGAISSVTAAEMENSSVSRPEQALQGRSAGVQVITTSGSPGGELKVRIRGYSSNGSADPLYIVDGVKTNNISYLAPQDISNMEVLKDAASSAIYGAEGGNGVIIITTKSGKSGYSSVDYDFQYASNKVGKTPDMLNSEEYANYYNEAGLFTINPADIKEDTDWINGIFESASAMRHHLSFSSGTEKSNFLLSATALTQDGIVVMDKDKYSRYTFRVNADTRVKDWLKVGNNVSFGYTQRNSITEDNESRGTITSALLMDPLTPVAYYDGVIPGHVQLLIDQGKKLVKDEDGNIYGISQYISKTPMNPYVGLANRREETLGYILQGSLFAELAPIKHVSFTSRLGYEIGGLNAKSWEPVYYYNSYNNYNDATSVTVTNTDSYYWLWENFASYTNNFNGHNISVLAGMSAEARNNRYTQASGGPMIKEDENYAELSFLASQDNSAVAGQPFLDKKASYFGRVSYDYQGRYLLQATVRRDGAGSSLLPPENRWGVFPSFSLGWVFTEESFFPESFISYGKLRASWGENGSLSNLTNYMYNSSIYSTYLLYQLGNGTMYTASVPNRLNNPELTWETSVQTDIGLDLRMLNDRINVTMDYYNKVTTDLITPNTPPLESGNNASAVNGGDVTNRGFEFELEYRKLTGDFTYSISGNFATLHNEVTYLNPTIQRISGGETSGAATFYTAFEEGLPVWYFRGYQTDGIDDATGQPVFVDQNDDMIINENDKTYIGSAIPSITYGGNINLAYKGFDFIATIQGQAGSENMILWMRNDLPGSNIPQFLYDDRWTSDNTDGSRPKAGFDPKTLTSDQMVFDGAYMRIKQLQIGYNLPGELLNRIRLKSVRVYVSLEDYFTFTSYPGMDPEAGSVINSNLGLDKGMYPVTKKALFGISVSL
jgi:TonB-linked SusC/RagA family outer membrane protein